MSPHKGHYGSRDVVSARRYLLRAASRARRKLEELLRQIPVRKNICVNL
jgi:hypothetical protein